MADQQYTYARFWKCALQVNPAGYAAAYRRQAHGLTGDEYLIKLLHVCREQDIRVVGLADHGSVQDVDAIRDFLSPRESSSFLVSRLARQRRFTWSACSRRIRQQNNFSAFLVGWI